MEKKGLDLPYFQNKNNQSPDILGGKSSLKQNQLVPGIWNYNQMNSIKHKALSVHEETMVSMRTNTNTLMTIKVQPAEGSVYDSENIDYMVSDRPDPKEAEIQTDLTKEDLERLVVRNPLKQKSEAETQTLTVIAEEGKKDLRQATEVQQKDLT